MAKRAFSGGSIVHVIVSSESGTVYVCNEVPGGWPSSIVVVSGNPVGPVGGYKNKKEKVF